MKQFSNDREALDFLAGRIAAEAEREGCPLSEVERKMLYFSDTDWTLPDMEQVSAEFDRDYDEFQYELKIVRLICSTEAQGYALHPEEMETWDQAVIQLSHGDRYLLVLFNLSRRLTPGSHPDLEESPEHQPHDRLKLLLAAIAIVAGAFLFCALGNWVFGAKFWAVTGRVFGDRDIFDVIALCALLLGFFVFKIKRRLSARRTGLGLPHSPNK